MTQDKTDIKILMVCLGNICRSPLAEGILRDKVYKSNLSFLVDSAGTASWHIGKSPDYRSQEVARKHGIDISGLRGRQFLSEDFDVFDKIYVMDASNYSDVVLKARTQGDIDKVELLLSVIDGKDNEVPDPYYDGKDGFELIYKLMDEACSVIINGIKINN